MRQSLTLFGLSVINPREWKRPSLLAGWSHHLDIRRKYYRVKRKKSWGESAKLPQGGVWGATQSCLGSLSHQSWNQMVFWGFSQPVLGFCDHQHVGGWVSLPFSSCWVNLCCLHIIPLLSGLLENLHCSFRGFWESLRITYVAAICQTFLWAVPCAQRCGSGTCSVWKTFIPGWERAVQAQSWKEFPSGQ